MIGIRARGDALPGFRRVQRSPQMSRSQAATLGIAPRLRDRAWPAARDERPQCVTATRAMARVLDQVRSTQRHAVRVADDEVPLTEDITELAIA